MAASSSCTFAFSTTVKMIDEVSGNAASPAAGPCAGAVDGGDLGVADHVVLGERRLDLVPVLALDDDHQHLHCHVIPCTGARSRTCAGSAIIGHQRVKADCNRLSPTKAVNSSHHGLTNQPSATDMSTNPPGDRRAAPHPRS